MRRVWWLPAAVVLSACGGDKLIVDPGSIDWGDVDFNDPVPATGHDPQEITLTNNGGGSLEVMILDLDDDRLTLGGQLDSNDPPRLTLAGGGGVAVLTLGVAGYEPGEIATEIDGELRFAAAGLKDDVIFPWSYVPQRSGGE